MSMFHYPDLFPPIIDGEDREISDKVLSLWSNFVTYGCVHTRVVPKQVLTLSKWTRSAIYQNSDEAHYSVVHYFSNQRPQNRSRIISIAFKPFKWKYFMTALISVFPTFKLTPDFSLKKHCNKICSTFQTCSHLLSSLPKDEIRNEFD